MSCDCNTLVVGEAGVQGPQGLAGINGTNGTNGINAFTTTSANFTQPSVGSPVTFSVVENRWISVGQTVYISQAGFYTVSALGGSPSFSSVTADLISTDGISVGGTVTSGRKVSPSASAVYSAPLASLTVTTGGVSSLDGPVTINESGNNADVRIEGNGDTHLLYCDANAGTTGRVGISTSAPETTLHVDGTFKVGTAATPADAVFTKGATFNSEQSGSGTDGDFLIKTQGASDTFFVDASKNFVGIGTNDPDKLLDVDGAAEMNTLLVNPGGVAANPSFQVYGTNSTRPITVLSTNAPFNGVGIFKTTPTVALDVVGATAISSTLAVAEDVTVGASVLKVDSTGTFVGINKATPDTALDVVGDSAISGILTVTGVTNCSSIAAASLNLSGAASIGTTLNVSGNSTLLSSLSVSGDFSVATSTLKVNTANNYVGINTDTPANELHVVGSVKASDYRVSTGSGAAKLTGFYFASTTIVSIASITAGTTTASSPITVTGAALGDFVQVTYGGSLPVTTFKDVVTVSGYVSATNTVVILLANNSVGNTTAQSNIPFNILVTRAAAS
jgi:hypothetical protein